MLADSVEASVRSLSSRDEPSIRAMVARIFDERISDDQFGDATSRCATSSGSGRHSWSSSSGCTTSGWRIPRTRSWSWSPGGPRASRP